MILDDYGNILLLHRSLSGISRWELPGGEVAEYEMAEEALMRTLNDELGCAVRITKALGNGEIEDYEDDFEYIWFQAVVVDADPTLNQTDLYDDLAYLETEDLQSLALAPGMQLLFDKIMSGEVVLGTPDVV